MQRSPFVIVTLINISPSQIPTLQWLQIFVGYHAVMTNTILVPAVPNNLSAPQFEIVIFLPQEMISHILTGTDTCQQWDPEDWDEPPSGVEP